MIDHTSHNFRPLPEPIAISEQVWPKGTLPFVATSTLTFNHESYIRECLDSILMQKTTFPVRICIFEDCSTDATATIIKEYINLYPQLFYVFFQPVNTWGKGEVRIVAKVPFTNASNEAKYTAFCEGDDYWTDTNKLQKQVDFLEANECFSGSFHDTLVIHENKIKENHLYRENSKQIFSAEDTLSPWSLFHTSSFVFKSEAFVYQDWIKNAFSGDMTCFSIVAKSGKLGKVDGVMSVYRKNEGGVTFVDYTFNEQFYIQRLILFGYLNELHEYKYKKQYHKSVLTILKAYRADANAFEFKSTNPKLRMRIKKYIRKIKTKLLNFIL